jgi:hypothetical protein
MYTAEHPFFARDIFLCHVNITQCAQHFNSRERRTYWLRAPQYLWGFLSIRSEVGSDRKLTFVCPLYAARAEFQEFVLTAFDRDTLTDLESSFRRADIPHGRQFHPVSTPQAFRQPAQICIDLSFT